MIEQSQTLMMGDSNLRPRPSKPEDCPIFQGFFLFVGLDDHDRRCWFGCMPARFARDQNIEEDLDWYRTVASNGLNKGRQLINICTVTKEDPNISKLLDQKYMEKDALAGLSADERTMRYANVLHGINTGRYNVREHPGSDQMRAIQIPFLEREPPGPRSSFGQDSDSKESRFKGKGKRSRHNDEADDQMVELGKETMKKMRLSPDPASHPKPSNPSYSPMTDSSHDGDNDGKDGKGNTERRTNDAIAPSGILKPKTKDQEPSKLQADVVAEAKCKKAARPDKARVKRLQEALEDLYHNEYAIEFQGQMSSFIPDASNRSKQYLHPLEDPEVAIRVGRMAVQLFGGPLFRAGSVLTQQRLFLDSLRETGLPVCFVESTKTFVATLEMYIRVMGEKISNIQAAIEDVEGAGREAEEEEL